MSDTSDAEEEVGILIALKDAILRPFSIVTSKSARRAYLGSVLLFITAAALLGFAVTAYLFFYYAYVPERGFTKPVYLQFEAGKNAFAEVNFGNRLVSDQPYDVHVNLHLPRTPSNIAIGNFMIQLELVAPQTAWLTEGEPILLAQERRPSILTYYSPAMEHIQNAVRLPLHVTGLTKESENLEVALMEGVEFARGRQNVPSVARIEVQSSAPLQVYSASISFRTKLRGLRYLMYKFRLSTFIVLTSIFWGVELTIAGLIWVLLPSLISGAAQRQKQLGATSQEDAAVVKQETDTAADNTADTGAEATPTSVKKEESQEPAPLESYPVAAEADIEDEGDEESSDGAVVVEEMHGAAPSDSGIGTSVESSARRDALRRRLSKNM